MRKNNKYVFLLASVLLMSVIFVGCGSRNNANNTTTETTTAGDNNVTTAVPNETTTSTEMNNTTDTKNGSNVNSVTDDGTGTNNGARTNVGEGVGNAVTDVGEGVGNAVSDVANGVGNAVSDIANGFTSYGDAHDYFMNQMQTTNLDAKYEIRNENKDLVDYNNGKKGYRFELYDSSTKKGTRVGEFYIDSETGTIYQRDEKSGELNEYHGNNTNSSNNMNNTSNRNQ